MKQNFLDLTEVKRLVNTAKMQGKKPEEVLEIVQQELETVMVMVENIMEGQDPKDGDPAAYTAAMLGLVVSSNISVPLAEYLEGRKDV